MKTKKKYPMNGPNLELQRIRLLANPNKDEIERMRHYAAHLRDKQGRTETIEAYEK